MKHGEMGGDRKGALKAHLFSVQFQTIATGASTQTPMVTAPKMMAAIGDDP